MPIFARRRLQTMLDTLTHQLGPQKAQDLRARLESKRVEQALPAEVELGVLWAMSAMGPLTVEPVISGSRRPDAYTAALFGGHPCVVEITAISDGRLSQEDDMRRTAARLCERANKYRKGHGRHLTFQFAEENSHTAAGPFRERKVESNFHPNAATIAHFHDWLSLDGDRPPLVITQNSTVVDIRWNDRPVHSHGNFFSSMPAETYSLVENPLFETLKEKSKQLAGVGSDTLRCVLIGNVGARLLREPPSMGGSLGTVSAQQIIEHFLADSNVGIDVVVTLSVNDRSTLWGQSEPLTWRARTYSRPGVRVSTSGVDQLASLLPSPNFEGYQARSLHQQAAFKPQARGWYLGTHISSRKSTMTIKVSARALLDLLAGRISTSEFMHFSGLDDTPYQRNIFKHRLDQGDVLSGVSLEHCGPNDDDDWLVMELKSDPAASPLQLKPNSELEKAQLAQGTLPPESSTK
jgi:hypothetical protein